MARHNLLEDPVAAFLVFAAFLPALAQLRGCARALVNGMQVFGPAEVGSR
jgi:hypothetical protein